MKFCGKASDQCNTKSYIGDLANSKRVCTPTQYETSRTLKRGAQRELMNAAAFSDCVRFSLNIMITINAEHLRRIDGIDGGGNVFSIGRYWDGFQYLHELMRKWAKQRGLQWVAIWAREWSNQWGEHWHIGLHMPAKHHADLAAQLAHWTGKAHAPDRILKNGEVAFSACGTWNITKHRRGGQGAEGIAKYLGKAEPNRIKLHGKVKLNPDKVRQGKHSGNGPIQGKRYGISTAINRAAQKRAAFDCPHKRKGRTAANQLSERASLASSIYGRY